MSIKVVEKNKKIIYNWKNKNKRGNINGKTRKINNISDIFLFSYI